MTATLRSENWVQDQEGMYSTVVVEIRDGEIVWVGDNLVPEFGLNTDDGEEVTDSLGQRFVWAFPYDKIKERLEADGWVHARPA